MIRPPIVSCDSSQTISNELEESSDFKLQLSNDEVFFQELNDVTLTENLRDVFMELQESPENFSMEPDDIFMQPEIVYKEQNYAHAEKLVKPLVPAKKGY
jgi:hypothetical protein